MDFWNKRYADSWFAYGTEPNTFLKNQLDGLKPGKAIFVAEGEGRNAVYAAKLGWDVVAFDTSEEGKKKAEILAKQEDVSIDYRVGTYDEVIKPTEQFDLGVFIFAHLPNPERFAVYQLVEKSLSNNGKIILEGFSKQHLTYQEKNPKVGGPKAIDFLLDETEIRENFPKLSPKILSSEEVFLNEGVFHQGNGHVVRFVGQK